MLKTALTEFLQILPDTEQTKIKASTLPTESAVIELTSEVSRTYKFRGQRYITRIEPFLQGVARFSGIVDTFIQCDPKISALIWGSLKLLLMVRLA